MVLKMETPGSKTRRRIGKRFSFWFEKNKKFFLDAKWNPGRITKNIGRRRRRILERKFPIDDIIKYVISERR